MEICSIYNQYTPHFGGWIREVHQITPSGERVIKHRNNTSLFRQDGKFNLWVTLENLISGLYINEDNINVYSYGCSNGLEPVSFLMHMHSNLSPDLLKKISKIHARDIDPVAIEKAKRGIYDLEAFELLRANERTHNRIEEFLTFPDSESYRIFKDKKFLKYLQENALAEMSNINKIHEKKFAKSDLSNGIKNYTKVNEKNKTKNDSYSNPLSNENELQYNAYCRLTEKREILGNGITAVLKQEYKDKIDYGVADIFDDYKNIKSSNSIVFARNFWPYLAPETVKPLIEKLGQTLKHNSIVIIGDFDIHGCSNVDFKKEFEKQGFACVGGNIFVKV